MAPGPGPGAMPRHSVATMTSCSRGQLNKDPSMTLEAILCHAGECTKLLDKRAYMYIELQVAACKMQAPTL
ncbi:hypothetical protein GN244_ATG08870 [Phytophthora infestans]|uniref:Uncharacterized protein n=1 Tax=Phytophthora infestans TaxID=4787 RepID=A0A833SVU4_PHYIN|nr:hypothetical protein GN244_ATG08870 [Phytophthora infestans]KAF4143575.1 hypothetical protein GN958_ATG07308 [Phytophthora infestans]